MATETGGRISPHVRGVTITTLATVMGVVAGVAAAFVTSGPTDTTGVLFVLGALLVQFPILKVLGIDVGEFGAKDNLYVAFMTVALWFVTWGILLTAGAA